MIMSTLISISGAATIAGVNDPVIAPTRGARRKARTRAALIEGARAVFARQGVDAATIAEIAEEADVGFGSFYNHFASKEEIADAVLTEAIAEQGALVADLTADLEDPAEIVSVAHRHFVRRARSDPDWARVLIRLDVSFRVVAAALGPHARRDLARGIGSRRLQVTDEAVAFVVGRSALLAVMRGVLEGELGTGADVHHAENVLRMLGSRGRRGRGRAAGRSRPRRQADPTSWRVRARRAAGCESRAESCSQRGGSALVSPARAERRLGVSRYAAPGPGRRRGDRGRLRAERATDRAHERQQRREELRYAMRRGILVTVIAGVTLGGALASSVPGAAGATVFHARVGHALGLIPNPNSEGKYIAQPSEAGIPTPVVYHGGAVMAGGIRVHTIFWAPSVEGFLFQTPPSGPNTGT